MFIKVSKTVYLFISGTIRIRIHIQPNSWYNYLYSAEYSQSLFGTALLTYWYKYKYTYLLVFYVHKRHGHNTECIHSHLLTLYSSHHLFTSIASWHITN